MRDVRDVVRAAGTVRKLEDQILKYEVAKDEPDAGNFRHADQQDEVNDRDMAGARGTHR